MGGKEKKKRKENEKSIGLLRHNGALVQSGTDKHEAPLTHCSLGPAHNTVCMQTGCGVKEANKKDKAREKCYFVTAATVAVAGL